ncbi:MAG: DMT family transporter, partial [Candidatus Nanopelagicales bacterium]|nr:DMT family transporter [Candidatus Nanopelagicales bacterium]
MAIANRLMATNTVPMRRIDSVGVSMYLLAAFLFALNGSISKLAMSAGLDPAHLTQLRSGGAMVVLIAFVLVTNRGAFRIQRGELPFLLAYGVIAFVLVQFLYFFTVSRLPLGLGTLLIFLAPVVVALWVRYGKKQPVSNRLWIAIALSLLGLALVSQVWQGFNVNLLGVLAGLLCAVILALYWLLGEAGQKKRDGVSLTMWGFIFATLTWTILQPWWD